MFDYLPPSMIKKIVLLAGLVVSFFVAHADETLNFIVKDLKTQVACKRTRVVFINTSSHVPGTVFAWKFGDLKSSKNFDTTYTVSDSTFHVYQNDGQYSVELERIDTATNTRVGLLKIKRNIITVYKPNDAEFENEPERFQTFGVTFKLPSSWKPFAPSAWAYDWDFGDGVTESTADTVIEVYHRYTKENIKPGFNVTLWTRLNISPNALMTQDDIDACYDSVTIKVPVLDGFFTKDSSSTSAKTPFIPNVFTPNGDGENDAFVIKDNDSLTDNMIDNNNLFFFKTNGENMFKLWVYNRWGGLVYKTEGKSVMWLGKNNTGDDLQSGVYYYVVESNASDKRHNTSGFIHLIRE